MCVRYITNVFTYLINVSRGMLVSQTFGKIFIIHFTESRKLFYFRLYYLKSVNFRHTNIIIY